MKKKKIAVIGAGAAGATAAINAAREGAEVVVFEKQESLGRKIAASGNGQCNISNLEISYKNYNGDNPRFVQNIFGRFSLESTRSFFLSLGLPWRERQQGRLYPYSLQARTVCDVLLDGVISAGCEIKFHRCVESISYSKNDKFTIITSGKEKYLFDSVILACGGKSFAGLGGSDRGYNLAISLGHSVTELVPAIVPLNIHDKSLRRLEGIKWDVALTAIIDGKKKDFSTGEILFTKYGISGPVTLDISGTVNHALTSNKTAKIHLDLFPDFSHEQLLTFIKSISDDRTIIKTLETVLKKRMPDFFLSHLKIAPSRKANSIKESELLQLVDALKGHILVPGEPRPFTEAVVTSGGVPVSEIYPNSCESKIVNGLYIVGELLDIDGDCGGYNLQFAWSSGAVAGRAASKPSS